MKHPFQCIATVKPLENAFLLAACGPKLLSTCLTTGEVVSEWTATEQVSNGTKQKAPTQSDGENGEGSSKKQKTFPSPPNLPNIIKLSVSPDQAHAVAVTDDKCVRVFQVHGDGKLSELSSRAMPKRPCAIQILPDNATILCGDKFGDVYSLPLLPKDPQPKDSTEASQPPEEPPFKPSATTQTVHTARNLKALESQKKQKNLTPKTKQPLAFEHQLLLGHVSMLTDMAYATREVDGKRRGYIITADRDEHIRVSRGPPQSHIIETYCLGHKAFVSKICVLPGMDLLLSGGGDEWLGLWEWPEGRLRCELFDFGVGIRHDLEDNKNYPHDDPEHIAVSGMWRVTANYRDGEGTADAVLVACEGLPVLVVFTVSELGKASREGGGQWWHSQGTDGPVLDVTCVDSVMFVSFDVREEGAKPLRAYKICVKRDDGGHADWLEMEEDEGLEGMLRATTECAPTVESGKGIDDLLYGIANLRKRGHREEAVDDEHEAAEEIDQGGLHTAAE